MDTGSPGAQVHPRFCWMKQVLGPGFAAVKFAEN
jgi:hypothetical protein